MCIRDRLKSTSSQSYQNWERSDKGISEIKWLSFCLTYSMFMIMTTWVSWSSCNTGRVLYLRDVHRDYNMLHDIYGYTVLISILRPANVSRQALIFYLWTFFAIHALRSETTQRRPVKSISTVRSYRCRTKTTLKHFARNFTLGLKKCEIWPRFSTPVAFEAF